MEATGLKKQKQKEQLIQMKDSRYPKIRLNYKYY